jgi:hypothetical protein
MHEYMLALKECLLTELKPVVGTSDVTASGEGYDETLHSLMQTFWDMFYCLQNSNQQSGHQALLLLVRGMMRLYTA